jgi:hypothetical protein
VAAASTKKPMTEFGVVAGEAVASPGPCEGALYCQRRAVSESDL